MHTEPHRTRVQLPCMLSVRRESRVSYNIIEIGKEDEEENGRLKQENMAQTRGPRSSPGRIILERARTWQHTWERAEKSPAGSLQGFVFPVA